MLAISLLFVTLFIASTAKASRSHLQSRAHHQRATLHADQGAVRFCANHRLAHRFCTKRNLRFWRARIRWTSRELRETMGSLRSLARPPHYDQWMCIHGYEGSWTDPNAPFWGGLQMDESFQKAYGMALYRSKGTADHWTPLEQMWVAERAWKTRGFYPWPNTARYCGLI